jgi:hypothetical protein
VYLVTDLDEMLDPAITREDVLGRSRTEKLSLTDPQEALKVARAIRHPWYRCQALSKVAEHWGTNKQKLALLEEALAVAREQKEINRVVTVSASPLEVMARIDPETVQRHLERLVELANSEVHTLRRADSLYVLARAIQDYPSLMPVVVPALVRALLTGRGWCIDRLIRSTIELVQGLVPEVVDGLVAHHSSGSKKRALMAACKQISK